MVKLEASCKSKENLLFPQKLHVRSKLYVNLVFRTKFMQLIKISEFSRFLPIILYNDDYLKDSVRTTNTCYVFRK